MKYRIIEMLERDERVELECVDEEAMIASNKSYADVLLSMPLIVSHIFTNKIVFNNGLFIRENNLKYFKIKEPVRSFNELVDVAVQAWKDGVLKNLSFEKGAVDQVFTTINGVSFAWHDGDDDYSGAIDTIRLIYTESFIIKTVDDIFNIKWKDSKALLQNGNEIELDILDGALDIATTFKLLKGATVTQKRGNQCNK